MPKPYKNWKLKNTALLFWSLILFYFLADTEIAKDFIAHVGRLGFFGIFLTGAFFVSIFTVAPALVVLYRLAGETDPYLIALLAGAGAVLGDFIILKIIKDSLIKELQPLFQAVNKGFVGKMFRTPYFAWLLPIVGAAIIASPFPDEIGISLLGLSRVKNWQFVLLTFFLNSVGIFLIITAVKLVN